MFFVTSSSVSVDNSQVIAHRAGQSHPVMLLYLFDHADSFPILESFTTARRVQVRMDAFEERDVLRLTVIRERDQRGELAVTLGLPPRSIDGKPESLQLEVESNTVDARVFLEVADACGVGVVYSLGEIDGPGRCVLSTSANSADQMWDGISQQEPPAVIFPIQLQRLRVVLGPACRNCDIRLLSLHVTGHVRDAAVGIA